MNKKILALVACIAVIPALATAKSVYKWTDENGVTHYGDRQPMGSQAESVSIRTGKGSSSGNNSMSPQQQAQRIDEQQSENQAKKEMTAADEARQKQRAANCETARSNLALIASGSRIKMQDNGEERYLTPEEIQEKKAQFREIADLNCGNGNSSNSDGSAQ
jgi:hypothetical protein